MADEDIILPPPEDTVQVNVPTPSNLEPWGYHAIMDCNNVDLASIQDETNIRAWITDLLATIEMEPIGEPIIAKTGVGQADKEGYTAIQIIVTSSIVAHFIDRDRHIYIDIFSCKQFNPLACEDKIRQYFGQDTVVKKILLPRNAAV